MSASVVKRRKTKRERKAARKGTGGPWKNRPAEHPLDTKKGVGPWTPNRGDVHRLVHEMYDRWGSWNEVAYRGKCSRKRLRRIRNLDVRAVEYRVMKRLIDGTGVGKIEGLPWYTAAELVERGVWADMYEGGEGWQT